jgi:hypothetical protein
MSASPDPERDWAHCAHTSDPCTMLGHLGNLRLNPFCAHGRSWPIAMKRGASGDLLLKWRAAVPTLGD